MDPTSDWQMKKTLFESNKYLLENEIDTDVTFRVGENQETIKAHKLILTSRSPVFDRILKGSFKETGEDPIIKDVDPETFRAVLRYCYYDCVEVHREIAFTTMAAAKMYMLPILEDKVRERVGEELDHSNVLDLYRYANSTGDKSLKKHCQDFIKDNIVELVVWDVYECSLGAKDWKILKMCRDYFQSAPSIYRVRDALRDQSFLKIKHAVLMDFLRINMHVFDKTEKLYENMAEGKGRDRIDYRHHFGIYISEIELFKACDSWAEAECVRQELALTGLNKREVLGDALFLIRIPTFSHKDLACVVCPTGILTEEEKNKMFMYEETDVGTEIGFPTRTRHVFCHIYCQDHLSFLEPTERLQLKSILTPWKGVYDIVIKDEGTGKGTCMRVSPTPTNYISSNGNVLCSFDPEPIILEAGRKYSILSKPDGEFERVQPEDEAKCIFVDNVLELAEVEISPQVDEKFTHILRLSLV